MHLQNGESRAGSFFQEYLWENSVELYKDNLEYTQRQISNVLLEGKHSNSSGNFIVDWKISPTLSKVTDPDLRLTPFRWDEQKYTIEPSESGDPTRIWRYLDEYNLTGKVDLTKNYSLFNRESKFKIGSTYTFKERDFEILNYRVYIRKEYLYSWSGDPDEILFDENSRFRISLKELSFEDAIERNRKKIPEIHKKLKSAGVKLSLIHI